MSQRLLVSGPLRLRQAFKGQVNGYTSNTYRVPFDISEDTLIFATVNGNYTGSPYLQRVVRQDARHIAVYFTGVVRSPGADVALMVVETGS